MQNLAKERSRSADEPAPTELNSKTPQFLTPKMLQTLFRETAIRTQKDIQSVNEHRSVKQVGFRQNETTLNQY